MNDSICFVRVCCEIRAGVVVVGGEAQREHMTKPEAAAMTKRRAWGTPCRARSTTATMASVYLFSGVAFEVGGETGGGGGEGGPVDEGEEEERAEEEVEEEEEKRNRGLRRRGGEG